MAYEFGTATDHVDLMDRLLDFLTTNPTLVAGNQHWEIIRSVGDDHLLRGRGADGTGNIFIRLVLYVSGSSHGILIWGFDSYNSAMTNAEQANMSGFPDYASATWIYGCTLWNSATNYWFFANGRHFKIVIKTNAYYHSLHGGLLLPYANETTEFQYPLYIGGSCGIKSGLIESYTNASYVASFWRALDTGGGGSLLRHVDGSWVGMGGNVFPYYLPSEDFPGTSEVPLTPSGSDTVIGGLPVVLTSAVGGGYVYGELDGVLAVKGEGISSEDIVTHEGQDYIVFQSAYRTEYNDYAAMRIA